MAPLFITHLSKRRFRPGTGVGDDEIEPAEGGERLVDQSGRNGWIGQISGSYSRLAAGFLHESGRGFDLRSCAVGMKQSGCAAAGEGHCNRATDIARGAGDNRRTSRKFSTSCHAHLSSLLVSSRSAAKVVAGSKNALR